MFSHFSFSVFVCPGIQMGICELNAGSRYPLEWTSIHLRGVEIPLVVIVVVTESRDERQP